jgi:hypothetical protein
MRLNSAQAIENGRKLLRDHGTWLNVIAAQRKQDGRAPAEANGNRGSKKS